MKLPYNLPDTITRHPLILPLYLPALLLSAAQGLILPVLPLFAQEFDAPFFWIGLVLAGDGLGHVIGDLPAGMVLRRLDRRRGMLIGIGLLSLSTLALFWSATIWQVFALRVLAGLGTAMYGVARHAYVAENITVASRGRSVALLGGTFRLGRMIGPVLAGVLAANTSLRVPFVVYAVVCLLALLVIAAFNRGGSSPAFSPPQAHRSVRVGMRAQARRIAMPGLGHYLMQMVRAGPAVVIPLYGSTVLGLNVEQIGFIFGAASFVDMTLFYPTGIIMDRFGRKWAMVPSAAIMALGLALIPFTSSFLGLALAAILNGFGNGLGSGVMLTLGADLAPAEARGEFLGLWGLIGDAGVTSGPVAVGAVADLLALQPAVWAIAGVGFAAAAVFGLWVPETLKKPPAALT
jgi:MFS family permease